MKRESMRKYTLLGLVLVGASAVTAAVLPKNDVKKVTGVLQNTNAGDAQQSCTVGTGGACTLTAEVAGTGADDGLFSRTSAANATSSITTANGIDKVKSITQNASGVDVNDIHTSVAN